MKKSFVLLMVFIFATQIYSQLKVDGYGNCTVDYVNDWQTFNFGELPYGNIGIEFENNEHGLNFWRPWNAPGYLCQNYLLFIKESSGNVGIGKVPSDSYALDVQGNIRASGTITPSDKRLKHDIKQLDKTSIEKLKLLNGVSFKLNKVAIHRKDKNNGKIDVVDSIDIDGRTRYGFIAQDVQKLFPDLVVEDEKGILGVDYVGLIPCLVEALKTQQAQIDELTTLIKNAGIKNKTSLMNNEAVLGDATPNPFSQTTKINCFIPDYVKSASLIVTDTSGKTIKTKQLPCNGSTTVEINSNELGGGYFTYALICDSKLIDSKRFIVTK